jgi:hypothetical protein
MPLHQMRHALARRVTLGHHRVTSAALQRAGWWSSLPSVPFQTRSDAPVGSAAQFRGNGKTEKETYEFIKSYLDNFAKLWYYWRLTNRSFARRGKGCPARFPTCIAMTVRAVNPFDVGPRTRGRWAMRAFWGRTKPKPFDPRRPSKTSKRRSTRGWAG